MRYSLQPHSLGRIVSGLDLKAAISQDVIKQLVNDVTEHRLLIFKNQGVVAPERQLEIRYNVPNLHIQMAITLKVKNLVKNYAFFILPANGLEKLNQHFTIIQSLLIVIFFVYPMIEPKVVLMSVEQDGTSTDHFKKNHFHIPFITS